MMVKSEPCLIYNKNMHKNKSLKITLALVMALLLMVGCASKKVEEEPLWLQRVQIAADAKQIKVIDVFENYSNDGTPIVTFAARSEAVFRQNIRVRALWFDEHGIPIRTTVSNWQLRTVNSKENFEIRFVGPSSRASKYKIEVQLNPS